MPHAPHRSIASRLGAHRLLLLIVAAYLSLPAYALDIETAESFYKDKTYHVNLSVIIAATPQRVAEIVRDYESYGHLDGRILDAKVISRDESNTVMLATKLRACFGLFCRTVQRVERVEEKPFEFLATVVPEQSDVLIGTTHTMLESFEGRTRVRYQSSVSPSFWVPSFIGRPLMLRTLREASLDLFKHVEMRARETKESR